jgi:DNA-binding NarL/FixJ family response regulator
MNPIQVLVVDDHPIVRQGIRSLLSNYPEFEIVGEADNGAAAIPYFNRQPPDVTLLDIRMPGKSGLEVLQQIRQLQPKAIVLMLTSFDEDEYVIESLRAGARGYVLKSASDEILVNAIRSVHHGDHVLSAQVTGYLVERAIASPPPPPPTEPQLDDEERQILRLLVEGASNTEIAASLYLSGTTVKRKLRKLFAGLEVQTRTQAAAEAVRRGLV